MADLQYNYGLMTDLYELTTAAGYFVHNCRQTACFELFVRKLPPSRNYLIVAGINSAIDYLSNLHFRKQDIECLRVLPYFKHVGEDFFQYLSSFSFTGELWAMLEGTLAFAQEPILRVTAPIIEAQLVETYLLSEINFQTMIATKASRIVKAANEDGKDRAVFEFGSRRAHGAVAAMWAARSAYLGGCQGTSKVAAGHRFNIPVFGTAAHSWTLAFDTEQEAFEKFYQVFPENCSLLIDTYNTLEGAKHATDVGINLKGVRIDSGNLLGESKNVRKILDEAGMKDTKIVASGDLNEYLISELISNGAPIDIFGVGTDLSTSRDAPVLGGIYKMVERIDRKGIQHYTAKFSPNKVTLPGIKQVFRYFDENKNYIGDTIGLAQELTPPQSKPLLVKVMDKGLIIKKLNSLTLTRQQAKTELSRLEEKYKCLGEPVTYPVKSSEALKALSEHVKHNKFI